MVTKFLSCFFLFFAVAFAPVRTADACDPGMAPEKIAAHCDGCCVKGECCVALQQAAPQPAGPATAGHTSPDFGATLVAMVSDPVGQMRFDHARVTYSPRLALPHAPSPLAAGCIRLI